jgi:DNA-binding NarL/FixJ family response regulator
VKGPFEPPHHTGQQLVIELVGEGRSNQAIGRALNVQTKTVETYVASIFTKLTLLPEPDDHRRVLAVRVWMQS